MSQLKFNSMVWQTFRLLFTISLFFVAAAPSAHADNTLTLEASTTLLNHDTGEAPEHVYVIHNYHNPALYWRADLLPSNNSKDYGLFAFYAVPDKDNAYYIYDVSAEQWLTYTVKDDYGTADKGTGTANYIKLSDNKV